MKLPTMKWPQLRRREPRHGRSRHSPQQWALLAVNLLVITACFVAAGGLVFAKRTMDSTQRVILSRPQEPVATSPQASVPVITAAPGDTLAPTSTGPTETFPPADPRAKNFLITGDDSNACVDPGSPWFSAADPNRPGGQRTDAIMVIRVDPAANRAAILSFPRDLWVSIPGRGKSRINAAHRVGEPQLMIDTLWQNFQVPIDYSIEIDFCAFKRLVDAVGGVSIPFDTPIKDDRVNLLIPEAGCHTFSGDEGLAYVRSRKMRYQDASGQWRADNGNDFARIARQQDFIIRTLDAALSRGILNPSVASSLYTSLREDLTLSTNLTLEVLLQFAGVLRSVDVGSIPSYQVEGRGFTTSGAQVLEPRINGENMKAILAIFRGEATLAAAPVQEFETTTTTAAPTQPPGTSTAPTTTRPPTGASTTTSSTPSSVAPPTANDPQQDVLADTAVVPSKTIFC
jgi:LCP family protein required for cell wall assembly